MLDTLLIVAALGVASPQVDTTVAVEPGDRVVLSDLRGEVLITGWDQDLVEVADDRSGRISVRTSGSTVRIARAGGRGRGSVDAVIRVPRWIDVRASGTSLEVTARGLEGEVEIATVSGDITVEDVGGEVDVRSVGGGIRVSDARGAVTASSQADDVVLERIAGAVDAHSGNGNVELDAVVSTSVRVEVQDGDVVFAGAIADTGAYGFYVHDGDVVLAIPDGTNASVHVSTFDGEFESEFTVRVDRFTAGREFDFVLGTGAARVEIEVFDGDISLVRL